MFTNRRHCGFKQFSLLGIPVTAITLPTAVSTVARLAEEDRPHAIFIREVASLMAAVSNPVLAALHFKASLVVPDGMPLVWAGRLKGYGETIGRVAGADLMDAVCAASVKTGQSHFFYGGAPGVVEEMCSRLSEKYPGLKVAGSMTPPMRAIGDNFELTDEVLAEVETIRAAKADFIWVGISSPKQEYWIMAVMPVIGHGVFFGVGAAFNFHSGHVRRAPRWMQERGLEWAYRLYSEPRRLWRRYLISAPKFVTLVLFEKIAIRARLKQKEPFQ